VRWHIVGPLGGVAVVGGALGRELIEVALQIVAGGGVSIFAQNEGSGGMKDEEMGQANAEEANLGRLAQ
jgi:hypothetical protein